MSNVHYKSILATILNEVRCHCQHLFRSGGGDASPPCPPLTDIWLAKAIFSDEEGVIHSLACFSMKTTSWAGTIRAKLICVVSACTRVIYSPAGFGQRLLAWRTSSSASINSFCPNWSRSGTEFARKLGRTNLYCLRFDDVNMFTQS